MSERESSSSAGPFVPRRSGRNAALSLLRYVQAGTSLCRHSARKGCRVGSGVGLQPAIKLPLVVQVIVVESAKARVELLVRRFPGFVVSLALRVALLTVTIGGLISFSRPNEWIYVGVERHAKKAGAFCSCFTIRDNCGSFLLLPLHRRVASS
jgi:hypothetical protein